MPGEIDLSFLEIFDNYDWKSSDRLEVDHAQLHKDLEELPTPITLSVKGIERLIHAGFYLLHQRRDRPEGDADVALALQLLEHTYYVGERWGSKSLRPHHLNNLAYAMILNHLTHPLELARAIKLLREPSGSKDATISSFAKRVQGQIKFAASRDTSDFTKKERFVREGVKLCHDGIVSLDTGKQVSEIARTYNRTAFEWLELARFAPTEGKKHELLGEAWDSNQDAQRMWNPTRPEDYIDFKKRTNDTAQEISAAIRELSQPFRPASGPKSSGNDEPGTQPP